MEYKVSEIFTSINGEGERAGEPAVFVRLTGCPLRCSYCDTAYALSFDSPHTVMTEDDIAAYITESGIRNVTLTGGEPLASKGVRTLLERLSQLPVRVEIETSGCVDVSICRGIVPAPVLTIDYKLPSSGMESRMIRANFMSLSPDDTVKFVAGSREDLDRALEVIREFSLSCHIHISPVWGRIDPQEIVAFMLEHRLNGVKLQLQLHKIVWDADKRGV
ncbi:MAG: putative 7-carboxy-7-deazaguanine synthase QueE [Oscillospiraceae bacterium]|nr:putative 7-carboxy-7-deazaguanine synthase QueE [Oscillospiraceae bacterium]